MFTKTESKYQFILIYTMTTAHLVTLLLTWFNFNPCMDK